MSDKKHIDRLFQEKFKDFEVKPNDAVWNSIQSQLKQPVAKPKVFPFWLRLAGIAALALLLLTIGNSFLGNNKSENTIDTIVETSTDDDSESTNEVSNSTKGLSTDNKTLSENNTEVTTTSNQNTANNKTVSNTEVLNPIPNTSGKSLENDNKSNTNASITTKNEENVNYVTASKLLQNNKKTNVSNSNLESQYTNTPFTNAVNTNNSSQNNSGESNKLQSQYVDVSNSNSVNANKKDLNKEDSSSQSQYAAVSNSNKINDNNQKSQKLLEKKYPPLSAENNILNKNDSNTNGITNKNTTIYTEDKTSQDALKTATTPSNTLKEGLAQTNNEEEEINMNPQDEDAQTPNPLEVATLANTENSIEKEEEETVMNRWTVNANVAPVYYNTLGKGSHIHDQFVDNPKNGELNTSYGINLGYALNKKLKIRSGISKLNLSYDTANVIVYENVSNTPSSAPLRNINFVPADEGQSISVLSASNLFIQQVPGVLGSDLNAAISQRLSYVEVPVEVEYALVNKRVGINIIGGFSTFFLDGNEVVTEVENRKTKIGEANNINTVSFTTNFGLGLDYKFNETFKFNLEPTFKYQVNAYSETSGDFKPYIIGLYTGFSYKF